jgi:DNA-binding NtrC family response regulator
MRPKQKRIHSRQVVDPRDDPRLLSIKARYLKDLTLAFLAEVETLEANRHLDIEDGLSLREEVRRFEVDLIKYALQRAGGNQTRAAVLLGVKATTLNSKIKLYRLQTRLFRCVAEGESPLLDVSTRPRPILAGDIAENHGAPSLN